MGHRSRLFSRASAYSLMYFCIDLVIFFLSSVCLLSVCTYAHLPNCALIHSCTHTSAQLFIRLLVSCFMYTQIYRTKPCLNHSFHLLNLRTLSLLYNMCISIQSSIHPIVYKFIFLLEFLTAQPYVYLFFYACICLSFRALNHSPIHLFIVAFLHPYDTIHYSIHSLVYASVYIFKS